MINRRIRSLTQTGFTISRLRWQWCRPDGVSRRQPRYAQTSLCSGGFTIIELMIATLVFSTILMVIVSGVIHFSNDYYKGIRTSATQNVARSVINSVAQSIQFGATMPSLSSPISPTGWLCAGSQQFVYSLGNQLQPGGGNYAVSQLSNDNCASHSPTGTELLQPHMRLTQFRIQSVGSQWTIKVGVAYGDNDLLCAPSSHPGSCGSSATLSDANLIAADVTCKPGAGAQYCATAELATTVTRRLN